MLLNQKINNVFTINERRLKNRLSFIFGKIIIFSYDNVIMFGMLQALLWVDLAVQALNL